MRRMTWKTRVVWLIAVSLAIGAAVTTTRAVPVTTSRVFGPVMPVGDGTASTFVEIGKDGEPSAIGIALSESGLSGLPTRMNVTSRCFDKDGNGQITHGECLGDYQTVLQLPAEAAGLNIPIKWATVNWNPEGHLEPAPPVWSAAHFDFHFFIADQDLINSIRPGPCGEFIDCEDFVTATVPLPEGHHPTDYIDVGAAVPSMGNHLIDAKDPELLDASLGFSHTFIYGVYGGRLIFLEPMISKAFLESRPTTCSPVKEPAAWATSGHYPTRYCIKYDSSIASYLITLEGLVFRQGTDASD